MWPLAWLKHVFDSARARNRQERDAAISAAIDEVAFDWALWQGVGRPDHVLHEQILEFGRAGTLNALATMPLGRWRSSDFELWDLIFSAIKQAQTYPERRYSDLEVQFAITLVKRKLATETK